MRKFATLAVCLVLGAAGTAQAIDIDFSGYEVGSGLIGQSGSTPSGGVSAVGAGEWTGNNDAVVVDGSMGTGGSETSTGPYVEHIPVFGDGPALQIQGLDTENGFWISALYSVTPALLPSQGHFAEIGLGAGGGGAGNMVWEMGTETFNFDDNNYKIWTPGDAISEVAVEDGQATLLVGQWDPNDLGAEVKLWVNPDLTQLPTAPDAVAMAAPDAMLGADTIVIRGGVAATHSVDNIYVGNTTPFIPEPATMSLLAVSGLGILVRRRRD